MARLAPVAPTIQRWKGIAAAALASFCLCLAAIWLIRNDLPYSDAAPAWFWAAVGVLLVLFLLRGGPRAALAATGVVHAFHWPPYWLGVSAGLGLAMIVVGTTDLVTSRVALDDASLTWLAYGGAGLLTLPAAIVLSSSVARRRRQRAARGISRKNLPTPSATTALDRLSEDNLETSLRAWLSSDDPVESAAQDFLERRELARLIASRLAPPNAHSQAVLGALGAGKSSLLNLVEEELRALPTNGSRREFVAIDLWRYETPRAAVEGILGVLIERLSAEMNVTFLRGIPHAYAEAMTAAGGPLNRIARPEIHARA